MWTGSRPEAHTKSGARISQGLIKTPEQARASGAVFGWLTGSAGDCSDTMLSRVSGGLRGSWPIHGEGDVDRGHRGRGAGRLSYLRSDGFRVPGSERWDGCMGVV